MSSQHASQQLLWQQMQQLQAQLQQTQQDLMQSGDFARTACNASPVAQSQYLQNQQLLQAVAGLRLDSEPQGQSAWQRQVSNLSNQSSRLPAAQEPPQVQPQPPQQPPLPQQSAPRPAARGAGNASQANSVLSLSSCSMQPGRAIADFDGSSYGREFISFATGDEVYVINSPQTSGADEPGQGWSIGYLQKDGTTGLFPASYWQSHTASEKAQPAPSAGVALSDFDGTQYGSDFMSFSQGDVLTVLQAVGRGSGWSYGICHKDSSKGLFPTAYCALKRTPQEAPIRSAQAQQEQQAKLRQPLLQQSQVQGLRDMHKPAEAPKQMPQQPDLGQEPVMLPSTRLSKLMPTEAAVQGGPAASASSVAPAKSKAAEGYFPPMDMAPAVQEEEQKAQALAVLKVLQAAGGKAPLANACAALLALGIMQGPHQNVCRNVVALVQSRQDLFEQLPKHWRMIGQKDLVICLKPSALNIASKVSR